MLTVVVRVSLAVFALAAILALFTAAAFGPLWAVALALWAAFILIVAAVMVRA